MNELTISRSEELELAATLGMVVAMLVLLVTVYLS